MTQKEVLKNLQADLQDSDRGKGTVTERDPESVIWRNRLRPRNTGVDT